MLKIISIISEKNLSDRDAMTILPQKLDHLIKSRDYHFIVKDTNVHVIRYISSKGFRNCTIYTSSPKPKFNPKNLHTKSFLLDTEVDIAMLADCSEVLKI